MNENDDASLREEIMGDAGMMRACVSGMCYVISCRFVGVAMIKDPEAKRTNE